MSDTRVATKQQEVIYSMLTENTGRALCDSGDYYGRHYERNQKFTIGEFIEREPVTVKFESDYRGGYWPNVTLDLFHFLDGTLDFDDEYDSIFHDQFIPAVDDEDGYRSYYEMIHEFADWLNDNTDGEWVMNGGDNTYNHDNCLSQDFQWFTFINQDSYETIVVLQTHNGCDARGGYSKPRVFQGKDEYSYYSWNDFVISAGEYDPTPEDQLVIDESIRPIIRNLSWDFRDGCFDYAEEPTPDWDDISIVPMPDDEFTWISNTIYVDKDGNGYIYGLLVSAYAMYY